jgi:hypothetical protein
MLSTGKKWVKESARGLLTQSFLLAFVISAHCADAPADLIPKLKQVPVCAALAAAAQSNQIAIGHIDSPSGTNTLHPGDSAAVLVTFFQKGNQTQWLLHLEAVAPDPKEKTKKSTLTLSQGSGDPITFESEPAPAKLRLLGPFAINNTSPPPKLRVADTRISLDKDFLGLGLDQAAALALRWDQTTNAGNAPLTFKPSPAEVRIFYGQFPALFSYVHVVMQTKELNDLLFKLVELPSVWSMVRHLGLNLNILADGQPAHANPEDWNLPASADVYYYPWLLELNGKPAVKITLVVTSPHPPLLICSGVVGILAEKAGDNETYMTLRIVNAQRN